MNENHSIEEYKDRLDTIVYNTLIKVNLLTRNDIIEALRAKRHIYGLGKKWWGQIKKVMNIQETDIKLKEIEITLKTKIEEIPNFSTETRNILLNYQIKTVEDLIKYIRNTGKFTKNTRIYSEICYVLKKREEESAKKALEKLGYEDPTPER